MDFSKYKFFYINGTSFTEGGGLEEESLINTGVPNEYKKKYNISWKNRMEVNWGKRLENTIGIKCINEAKSGGSASRVIRKTYDFIYNNWKDKDKFFIILEYPDVSRCDVFLNNINEYYIVNTDIKTNKLQYATREYFNKKYIDEDKKVQFIFKNWVENHYNIKEELSNNDKNLIGLYSFCKLYNIEIYLMNNTNVMFTNIIDKKDICVSINEFCKENKLLIKDEIPNTNDGHPGYYGHIEYANYIYNFLQKNKTII